MSEKSPPHNDIGAVYAILGCGEERLHPEDRERVLRAISSIILGQVDAWNEKYRICHKEGEYVSVENRGHVARDGGGRGIRLIGERRNGVVEKISYISFFD